MIIAVEGIDGAGKNTLVNSLIENWDSPQTPRVIAFPRYKDSVIAQLISDALHDQLGDTADSTHGMATLFALDRWAIRDDLLAAAGEDNPQLLILDRYIASNAAYSVARSRNSDLAHWVKQLELERLGLPKPDVQILVDTSPTTAAERAARRENSDPSRLRDSYERDSGLQERTFAAYLRFAKEHWLSPWLVTSDYRDILQYETERRGIQDGRNNPDR